MDFINEVIAAFGSIPSETWTTIGQYLAGSTLVATILQIIKHRLRIKDAKKLVTFLLGFLSFLAAFADFILLHSTNGSLPQLGQTTSILVGGAVFMHRFAVSPAYYRFAASLTKFGNFLDELNELQASKKAIATPQTAQAEQVNLRQFQV